MSEFTQHNCPNCGGILTVVDDESLKCRYCGCTFENHSIQRSVRDLQAILDQAKIEYVNNQRRNLYDAIHAKYISMAEVRQYATEIKKNLPDDFQANFYLQAISGDAKEINRAIREIDVDVNYDFLAPVIHFLISSLQIDYLLELNNLVERAYKKRDLPLFSRFATEISEEAEKVSEGVYATGIPRDVFIAYSSKDMEHVSKLCEELESQGISCFVAARNLRHGVGSVENYDRALQEAMDNCRCFVFVSTVNSRSLSCDAVTKEIPHIRSGDLANAPAHLRNNYSAIPDSYKKPRVEYRVGTEKSSTAADKITNAFFEGYEWVYTPEAVALRVAQMLYEMPAAEQAAAEVPPARRVTTAAPASKPQPARKKGKALLVAVVSLILVGAVVLGVVLVPRLTGSSSGDPGQDSGGIDTSENGQSPEGTLDPSGNAGAEGGGTTGGSSGETDGNENASVGLEFTVIGKGTCYVTGIGTCTDTDLVIPSVSPAGDRVTGIADEAFANRSELTSITIPDGVTYIGERAFNYCPSLLWVDIPNSVTKISNAAFSMCSKLASISIPSSVTSIGEDAFHYCRDVISITVDPTNEYYESIGDCLIEKSTKTLLVGCKNSYIPIDGSVTNIAARAFYWISEMKSFHIPDGVVSIGDSAFESCGISEPLVIPASVQHIGNQAFRNNYFESVTVDPQNTTYHSSGNCVIETASKKLVLGGDMEDGIVIPTDGSVTSIGEYAFAASNRITSIQIPEGIVSIDDHAFSGCSELEKVDLPDSLTDIGTYAFEGCYKLNSITLPNNVKNIGDYTFTRCESLSAVTIPGSVEHIGEAVFTNCDALSSIEVDSSNTKYHSSGNCLIETATKTLLVGCSNSTIPADGSITSIGDYAFISHSLTSITVPEGVTSIGEYAFASTSDYTIAIPASVTSIGKYAFASSNNGNNIIEVYYAGTEAQWEELLEPIKHTTPDSMIIHFES